jgi:hydroxymethylbilane synthase
VLGSRGSALALAQVALVREALTGAWPGVEVELKIITTSGDRRQEVRAGDGGEAGLKGLFTKEIQEALLRGEIDGAVHSLKDLPGITPAELGLAAVLRRADTADVLICREASGLKELKDGARVGTGSVRRRRQVGWLRPGLELVELRGNVPTRLEKLAGLDAIVLARAGLERLGYVIADGVLECDAGKFPVETLDVLPAIGQGVVGIETRVGEGEIFRAIDHAETHACVRVERELLRLLDGDCRLPVGARATLDGETLTGEAIVFPEDVTQPPAEARGTGPASEPAGLAARLFEQLSGILK